MTCRARLFYFDEERVLVAVIENVLDALYVSGGFSLLPEFAAGAAPEPGEPGLNRSPQRFGVHVGNHQDLVVLPVLNHGRDQALFVEFEVIRDLHRMNLLSQI